MPSSARLIAGESTADVCGIRGRLQRVGATESTGRDVGLAELRAAIETCRARDRTNMPIFTTAVAKTDMQAGVTDAALATIENAAANTERHGHRGLRAETHRVRGEFVVIAVSLW